MHFNKPIENNNIVINTTNTNNETKKEESEEKANIKIDMEKFAKELSYKSLSTVNDGIHGGDGYRYDYNFYNGDLTIADFKINNLDNEIVYTLETNGNSENNYKFVLTAKVGYDSELKEINITCTPPTLQAKGILNCAMEVEEALGYTLFNSRNHKNITLLEDSLKTKGYVDKTSRNYEIQEKDIVEQIKNEENGEIVVFTFKEQKKYKYHLGIVQNVKNL